MPAKPNYDFERRERERLKKAKVAARAEAKQKSAADTPSETNAATPPSDD